MSFLLAVLSAAAVIVVGCKTAPPPGVERGPHGTIAYEVLVEASPPGAHVEANGQVVGDAPIRLKIYGDKDGTFHDFGSYYYVIRGLPLTTNQFVQTVVFRTGRWFSPEDQIPQRVYLDMNQNTTPPAGPIYLAPGYPPPLYYGPPPYYYGPRYHFYFGPGGYYHRHHY